MSSFEKNWLEIASLSKIGQQLDVIPNLKRIISYILRYMYIIQLMLCCRNREQKFNNNVATFYAWNAQSSITDQVMKLVNLLVVLTWLINFLINHHVFQVDSSVLHMLLLLCYLYQHLRTLPLLGHRFVLRWTAYHFHPCMLAWHAAILYVESNRHLKEMCNEFNEVHNFI